MNQRIILCVVAVFALQACTKTEYVDVAPQMLITVVEENMVFVEDATVSLYNSQEEWEADSNIVISFQTDDKGQVLFEDLNEQRYFFYVEKGELNNLADIAATSDSLQKGKKSELLVKITETQLQR